jgi:hypothetical protein
MAGLGDSMLFSVMLFFWRERAEKRCSGRWKHVLPVQHHSPIFKRVLKQHKGGDGAQVTS